LFLWWGWMRSILFSDVVHYESRAGDWSMSLSHGDSRLSFTWRAYSNGKRGFMYQRFQQRGPVSPWFQQWLTTQERATPRRQVSGLAIADWFLILLFLVPWVSFLVWHRRRMGRLVAGSVEPVAGDGV
jgi:hypothetical protein